MITRRKPKSRRKSTARRADGTFAPKRGRKPARRRAPSRRNAADRDGIHPSPKSVAVFVYRGRDSGFDVNAVADARWSGGPAGDLLDTAHVRTLTEARAKSKKFVKEALELGATRVTLVDVEDNHTVYPIKRGRR